MEYAVIGLTAFGAALLTFFSGFGLGTLLMPVFALFFPVEIAIALTGVVHFLNGLFKLTLVGKSIDRGVWLRFGLPAFAAAWVGAWVLGRFSGWEAGWDYEMWGRTFEVSPVKAAVGGLLAVFALLEWFPVFDRLEIGRKWLPVGGLLSGFFGGLSGHQGALRSAFLIRAGLGKEAFVATGVGIAALIDVSRLGVYARQFWGTGLESEWKVLAVATLAAFAGAFLGNRLLKKITLDWVQRVVAVLLLVMAVALVAGWI
jgi:hypothetical protein